MAANAKDIDLNVLASPLPSSKSKVPRPPEPPRTNDRSTLCEKSVLFVEKAFFDGLSSFSFSPYRINYFPKYYLFGIYRDFGRQLLATVAKCCRSERAVASHCAQGDCCPDLCCDVVERSSPLVDILAGSVGGMCSVVVGQPFDVVKVFNTLLYKPSFFS